MQLYAFNQNNELILAHHAKSKENYTCLECNGLVRLRKGHLRKAHYYHIKPNISCSQQGKSLTHLVIQEYLFTLLPGNVELEKRFPTIGRIADVVWQEKNLIFEIQCSPIDEDEVIARNKDYRSLGFEVVWILHDKRYNKWRHTLAEKALLNQPRYFTNLNQNGKGIIYDQFEIIQHGIRKVRFAPIEVDLSQPLAIGFQGDFNNQENSSYYLHAKEIEKKYFAKESFFRKTFRFLKESYIQWLNRQLEKKAISYDL